MIITSSWDKSIKIWDFIEHVEIKKVEKLHKNLILTL